MSDERERKLAQLLVDYSVDLHKGERCLINAVDVPSSMVEELITAVYRKGGYPEVNLHKYHDQRERLSRGGMPSRSHPLQTVILIGWIEWMLSSVSGG